MKSFIRIKKSDFDFLVDCLTYCAHKYPERYIFAVEGCPVKKATSPKIALEDFTKDVFYNKSPYKIIHISAFKLPNLARALVILVSDIRSLNTTHLSFLSNSTPVSKEIALGRIEEMDEVVCRHIDYWDSMLGDEFYDDEGLDFSGCSQTTQFNSACSSERSGG